MACMSVVVGMVIKSVSQKLTDVDPAPMEYPPLRPLPFDAQPLEGVERLFEGDEGFRGPESFAFDSATGSVYTGLADGRIVRMFGLGHGTHSSSSSSSSSSSDGEDVKRGFETIARTGDDHEACGTLAAEPTCGRPLGLRWDRSFEPPETGTGESPGGSSRKLRKLLVADAYKGLLRVDVVDGAVEVLVDPVDPNTGARRLTLVNDLDVSADGRFVFFSDTGRFPRNEIHKLLVEGRPTGSLWCYDLARGRARVLVPELVMPNGVTLTHDGAALLVCSTFLSGLLRVELPGGGSAEGLAAWFESQAEGGQEEEVEEGGSGEGSGAAAAATGGFVAKAVLVNDDIQGTVDNIRRHNDSGKGNGKGTYLVALGSKRSTPFSLPQFLAPFHTIRRLSSLLGLETITGLVPRSCLVVEVDDRGRELRTLTDASKTCYWASEAEVIGGWLYIGSWRTPFLARARLPTAN